MAVMQSLGRALMNNRGIQCDFVLKGFNLSVVGVAIGTPPESTEWDNATFIRYFSARQREREVAFALCQSKRVGSDSPAVPTP